MTLGKPKPAPKAKKKYNGLKTTPADKWFSLCVRERANWTCEYPGCRKHIEPPTRELQCAHYDTRDIWSTRLDPLNAFCLCDVHHMRIDRNGYRMEFENLYLSVFGIDNLEILREHWRDNAGLGKLYKQTEGKGAVAEHYKKEFERMEEMRAQGFTGRIEFSGWL
jgi:hypothetical protein